MDQNWQILIDHAHTARFIILVINLSLLVPLSIIEIAFIQKFKVDKLFAFTCVLYTTCFSFRLIYLECFENAADLTPFQKYYLAPAVLIIQGTACLCLTYYILIIEFVKITLISMSPQIKLRKMKRHRRLTLSAIGLLFIILIAQTVLDQFGYSVTVSILGIIYGLIISSLCIRFVWIINYFIDKKS